MKKWYAGLAALLVLSLAGCAVKAPVWETVDDAVPVSAQEAGYTLTFAVPEDATPSEQCTDARMVCEQADGDYEIVSETIPAASLADAVRALSGFDEEKLGIVRTSCGGLPGYQLAWYDGGEEGGRFCRAELVMDGNFCHAVTFSVREGLGNRYDSTAEALFASVTAEKKDGI